MRLHQRRVDEPLERESGSLGQGDRRIVEEEPENLVVRVRGRLRGCCEDRGAVLGGRFGGRLPGRHAGPYSPAPEWRLP